MPIATINPATGETLQTFQPLSKSEIEQKLQLAVATFHAERKTPFAERARRMLKAADILERDKDKFAHLMTLEMGKPYKAAVAEAVKCTTACRYYADNAEKILTDEVIDTGAKKSFVRYRPIGPILAVMPWNFPFWQVIRFAAPALMAEETSACSSMPPTYPSAPSRLKRFFSKPDSPPARSKPCSLRPRTRRPRERSTRRVYRRSNAGAPLLRLQSRLQPRPESRYAPQRP